MRNYHAGYIDGEAKVLSKRPVLYICALLLVYISPFALSHSGGLDANGCHGGSKPYHCHRSPGEMVKSLSGQNRLRCSAGSRSQDCIGTSSRSLSSGADTLLQPESPLPSMEGLSRSDQDWVRRTCPSQLGPSLTISCMNREVGALRGGVSSMDDLSKSNQDWVRRTCPSQLGPSLMFSCMNREIKALRNGVSGLAGLSKSNQDWIRRSCPSQLGPSLTISCMNREIRALRGY